MHGLEQSRANPLSAYRREAFIGAAIGLAVGFGVKPLAALCLILAMAANSL